MSEKIKGNCLCNAVSVEINKNPEKFTVCHCENCRRWSGGVPMSINAGEHLKFSGEEFIKEFFPNANITADKFHVLRLLSPALLKKRKEITGTRADAKAKRLLLMSARKLDYTKRIVLLNFLKKFPELDELYSWKERLHGFYRIKGYQRAKIAFTHMTDDMAASNLKEIKTLRKTLLKWREEILNYFRTGLTNARTEGFNNKAKLVKRRAYESIRKIA